MLAAPVPVAPPVTPPVTTGSPQLYVVPGGTMPFVPLTGAIENAEPLQAAPVILVTAGLASIVTTTSNGVPTQLPRATEEIGVTV